MARKPEREDIGKVYTRTHVRPPAGSDTTHEWKIALEFDGDKKKKKRERERGAKRKLRRFGAAVGVCKGVVTSE